MKHIHVSHENVVTAAQPQPIANPNLDSGAAGFVVQPTKTIITQADIGGGDDPTWQVEVKAYILKPDFIPDYAPTPPPQKYIVEQTFNGGVNWETIHQFTITEPTTFTLSTAYIRIAPIPFKQLKRV